MAIVVAILGLLIAAIGVVGVFNRQVLRALVINFWLRRYGLPAAVAIRLIVGVLLILAAPSCRFSAIVRIIGIATLIAAAGLLLLGTKRLAGLVGWVVSRPSSELRLWAGAAVAFGVFLLYAGSG